MTNAIRGIAFIVLLIGGIQFAQSDQPAPTPTVEAQPIQPKTKSDPKQPDSYQRGTEQAPVIVKILDAPKTDAQTAQDAQDREDHAANDRRLSDLTNEIAIFTGFLVIVGFLQFCVLAVQAVLLRGTIKASQAAERARVYVDVNLLAVAEGPEDGDADVIVNVKFTNHGRTAASFRQLRAYMQVVDEYPIKLIDFVGSEKEIPAGKAIKGDGGDWTTKVEQKIYFENSTTDNESINSIARKIA